MSNLLSLNSGKILVTGGAGFIGSALIWQLNQMGQKNILVSDFLGQDEKYRNLVPLAYSDYLEADDLLKEIESDSNSIKDVKLVFHLGACSATTEKDCRYLIENNYEYTKAIAQWALRNNARFVYASSAATYGNGSQGMLDDQTKLNALRPLNMYGYSKHMFDIYAREHGFLDKVVGLKYFNIFGPNEHHKGDMRSVVHKAFRQICTEGIVSLFKSYHPDYKDGEQMRDFLYVKDAVKMTIALGMNPNAGGIYNIGSGEAHTWLELVTAIFTALGKDPKIEFIPMPESLQAKYQYYTCADISRLRATGYDMPVTPLATAVYDYVQNYLVPERYLGD